MWEWHPCWLEVNVGTVLLNRECALGPHSDDANILVIKLAVISISGSGKNLVTTASTSPSVCMSGVTHLLSIISASRAKNLPSNLHAMTGVPPNWLTTGGVKVKIAA